MKSSLGVVVVAVASLSGAPTEEGRTARLAAEVRAAETAFAATMAARDHLAFAVLRGRTAVADGWKPFFDGPTPPFSWEPAQVEVLDSGTLALSTGPVRDPQGRPMGTFNSVWRRERNGGWKLYSTKAARLATAPPTHDLHAHGSLDVACHPLPRRKIRRRSMEKSGRSG